MGEADVFATSGMSVYKVFDTRVQVEGKGKLTLEELLTGRNYKRIYLMLGINELGYEFERSIRKYRSVHRQPALRPPGYSFPDIWYKYIVSSQFPLSEFHLKIKV